MRPAVEANHSDAAQASEHDERNAKARVWPEPYTDPERDDGKRGSD